MVVYCDPGEPGLLISEQLKVERRKPAVGVRRPPVFSSRLQSFRRSPLLLGLFAVRGGGETRSSGVVSVCSGQGRRDEDNRPIKHKGLEDFCLVILLACR